MGKLLSTQQAAEALGVTETTIRRLTRRGKLPFVRLSKKLIRYNLDELVFSTEEVDDAQPE